MSFADDLDRWAGELQDSPDLSYEIAIDVATCADRYNAATPSEAAAVAQLRDVFGTWVERIHNPTSDDLDDARTAHREIADALEEWATAKDRDIASFATRLSTQVGPVDAAWLRNGAPLARQSRARRFWSSWKRT